jgi:NAD(P)-dependent dehydrogenase (short-subunit alcohol dehydrogenase family)
MKPLSIVCKPEDKWDAIIAVCLTSAFHTTKTALPGMVERGWGRIINTGDMAHFWELKPIGYTWSYLACRIGHLVPIWQACTGSSLH